ncbi:hypothetical protein GCM10009555_004610 [Acrocarpospora macrocephala]|uniref:Uncharacterized protein n=1 Tax=Acrocarpospora macrocephala TaxID=150177 RepID=A0A5M3X190_9ACTN|nr:hypothetical protein [Acrocarpospora macrocephala]GES13331.1 hypothetical protein Amac_069280 [Acrocarpospora macrocephala]
MHRVRLAGTLHTVIAASGMAVRLADTGGLVTRQDHRAHPARQDRRSDPPARRHPRSVGDIPVVYITVPPAATPKMIAMEFARFSDLPISRRGNITDIAEAESNLALIGCRSG